MIRDVLIQKVLIKIYLEQFRFVLGFFGCSSPSTIVCGELTSPRRSTPAAGRKYAGLPGGGASGETDGAK